MSFNDWDQPVDYHRVRQVMEQVSITRPLIGGRVQDSTSTKSPYSMLSVKSLKAARKQANALIARRLREGEQVS